MRIITCKVCNQEKPHQAHGMCNSCYQVYQYVTNPARKKQVDEAKARFRKTDKSKDYNKKYYAEHKEIIKAQALAWYYATGKARRNEIKK